MNCQPNQLCRIVRGSNAQTIVRTVERCGCFADLNVGAKWECELMQSILTVWGARYAPGEHVCIPDANLKPLGGDEKDPADITVTEKLETFIREEVKKIPIMPMEQSR